MSSQAGTAGPSELTEAHGQHLVSKSSAGLTSPSLGPFLMHCREADTGLMRQKKEEF